MDRKFECVVTEDPLKDAPIGFKLSVAPFFLPAQPALTTAAQTVDNPAVFEGTILSVGLRSPEGVSIVGTAVLVAPGLAVTATHLFDEKEMAALSRGELAPFCMGISNNAADLWFIRSISYAPGSDVAFMTLELRSELPVGRAIHKAVLTTRQPAIGELLAVIGFRVETVDDSTFGGNLYAAAGKVEEVHQNGFVPSRPTPVVMVGCDTLGKMSGGAAFDSDGFLVGIISSGMTPSEAPPLSYIALFPAALNREVAITWPKGLYKQPVHILDIHDGLLTIEGRDKIQFHGPNNDTYSVWSERPRPSV